MIRTQTGEGFGRRNGAKKCPKARNDSFVTINYLFSNRTEAEEVLEVATDTQDANMDGKIAGTQTGEQLDMKDGAGRCDAAAGGNRAPDDVITLETRSDQNDKMEEDGESR